MKGKHLMAAVLGCVTFLTGCTSERSSDNYTSRFSESISSEKYVESSKDISVSSIVSNVINEEYSIPSLVLNSVTKQSDDTFDSVTLNFTLNGVLEDGVEYYLRVHWQNMMNGDDKIVYDKPFNKDVTIIKCKNYGGENGYKIQLYTNQKEGEWSEELYYDTESQYSDTTLTTPSVTEMPKVHQYTHTFDTPAGITVVPDYTKSLNELQDGVQPYSFYVRIYYTCPLCGHKKEVDSANFYYSFDSSYTVPFVRCGKASCPNAKSSKKATINYYATQIS